MLVRDVGCGTVSDKLRGLQTDNILRLNSSIYRLKIFRLFKTLKRCKGTVPTQSHDETEKCKISTQKYVLTNSSFLSET
jgi:hypothetical protein